MLAVTGNCGGGKYACATAWALHGRVTRVALAAPTCPLDTPAARATLRPGDKAVYAMTARTPWLARAMFAKLAHDAQRDARRLFSFFDDLGPADQRLLQNQEFATTLSHSLTEAFRQGARGQVQDHALEGQPWRIPLEQIRVPVTIWYGDDDRLVDPRQSQILAAAIPTADARAVAGAGHFLLGDHAAQVLSSAVGAEPHPPRGRPSSAQ